MYVLSETMQRMLAAIERDPGKQLGAYPGNRSTVLALMRRRKIEIDESWHLFPPAHAHEWKLSMHMDGCHHFSSSYMCDCGAALSMQNERNLKSDPYSAVWMGGDCARCRELANGARPTSSFIIQRSRRPVAA